MLIRTKKDFYQLSARGLCGNTMQAWGDVEEYWPHRHRYPRVGIRDGVSTGGVFVPRVAYQRLRYTLSLFYPNGGYIITEVPPLASRNLSSLQGELSWGPYDQDQAGWILHYTHSSGYMRQRLAETGQHAYGWGAQRLLKGHMSTSEYREIMELFERYTEDSQYPVIEFTMMRKPMGRYNRRLVIWEIRHY
jgi:hypothetical protein